MLVLCYGFPRSGSTLTWQLVRGVLMNAGYPQEEIAVPGVLNNNFIPKQPERLRLSREDLSAVLRAIGPDRKLAVKTHEPAQPRLLPWLDELQETGQLQVIASYRDPRDVCLSLLDAGEKARSRGEHAFSLLTTLDKAAESVERRVEHFRLWGAVKGAVCLSYDTAVFTPDVAIAAIAASLRLSCDPEAVKAYAFGAAEPHRNKAIRERYRSDLPPDEADRMTERFRDFMENVSARRIDGWFAEYRVEVMDRFASKDRGFAAHGPP